MKINTDILKRLRNEAKITQEDAADIIHVSLRQFARIESGETNMDMWQFKSYMEALGQSSEDFWLLYLDTKEYDEYKEYKRLKLLLRNRRDEDIKKMMAEQDGIFASSNPYFRQYLEQVKIKLNKDLPNEQKVRDLFKLMKITKKKFEESKIPEYRLTFVEISILTQVASCIFAINEHERAIRMIESMIKSKNQSYVSEEDRGQVFPALYSNLSTMLGKMGRFKESLKVSNEGIEICREYENFRFIPGLLYNKACSLLMLGEEEVMYKPYLVRAYHCAFAIGDLKGGNIIKKDAKVDFGIELD